MPNKLRASGFLFMAVFLFGYALNLVIALSTGKPLAFAFFRVNQSILLVLAALFLISAVIEKARIIQPILFLATSVLPIMEDPRYLYGLGFYIIGVLLLERAGFLIRRRGIKVVVLSVLLLAIEVVSAIRSKLPPVTALAPTFYVVAFGLFLWFLYKDRLVVYFAEPKAKLSLTEKGLSNAERAYVLSAIRGKQQKEVAIDFEVAESTVRNTLARAYHKLGVEDKSGLAALAEKYEIVE